MDERRKYQLLAKESRVRREQARAQGDSAEASRWDGAERDAYAALNVLDGVDESIVGSNCRTL